MDLPGHPVRTSSQALPVMDRDTGRQGRGQAAMTVVRSHEHMWLLDCSQILLDDTEHLPEEYQLLSPIYCGDPPGRTRSRLLWGRDPPGRTRSHLLGGGAPPGRTGSRQLGGGDLREGPGTGERPCWGTGRQGSRVEGEAVRRGVRAEP